MGFSSGKRKTVLCCALKSWNCLVVKFACIKNPFNMICKTESMFLNRIKNNFSTNFCAFIHLPNDIVHV